MSRQRIDSPMAWKGPEIDYTKEMMHLFTEAEVAEVDAALKACGDADVPDITRETFVLPGFGPKLTRLRDGILDGRGVLLLRGFPRERYSVNDMARIYVGIGAHLGQPIAQSWQGQLLGSVIDISDVIEKTRGYNHGGEMGFHIDGTACDIVALTCLRRAKSGGASRIVSVAAVHNAMLETRPDLLEALYRGFYHRNHEMDALHSPMMPLQTAHRLPYLSQRDGRITCSASGCIRYAVEYGGVDLSPREFEALEEWQRLARSPEFYLDMNFEEGDMQFLNNRAIMHGRTDYEDAELVPQRRHLLRLWLHVPEWPAREPNQVYVTPEACRHWQATNRKPGADFPEDYLAQVAAIQERRIRESTVLAAQKSIPSAAHWRRPAAASS